MRLGWSVKTQDVERLRELVREHARAPIVQARRRNLAADPPAFDRTVVWRAIVASLVSSRQRSAAGHPVSRFLIERPFPLEYDRCAAPPDPHELLAGALRDAGGLGRSFRLADHLADILDWLRERGWQELESRFERLDRGRREAEIALADWLDGSLAGFGPREARRLLLMLGLTRHELPLDARLLDWLNRLPVTPRLSASALGERGYYRLVLDGVQQLCAAGDVVPCVFDASVLAAGGLRDDDASCWS